MRIESFNPDAGYGDNVRPTRLRRPGRQQDSPKSEKLDQDFCACPASFGFDPPNDRYAASAGIPPTCSFTRRNRDRWRVAIGPFFFPPQSGMELVRRGFGCVTGQMMCMAAARDKRLLADCLEWRET